MRDLVGEVVEFLFGMVFVFGFWLVVFAVLSVVKWWLMNMGSY